MSVDFAAILGHSLDNSAILSLPERFNSDPRIGKATARFYQFLMKDGHFPLLSPDDTWYWGDAFGDTQKVANPEKIWNEISLHGPGILSLNFGKGAICFSAPMRFSTFVFDTEAQIETRRVCYAVTQALGGDEAIYFPDSGPWKVQQARDLVWDSYSLAQIREWLGQNIGVPVKTIPEVDMVMRNDNVSGGYYIDRFEDIRTDSEQSMNQPEFC